MAAIAFAALVLAGCASAPPRPPAAEAASAPAASPDSVREWAGRFAVRIDATDPAAPQEAAAGRFSLTSRALAAGRSLELELLSPFGQVLAAGRREPDGAATLTLSDGRVVRAASMDMLLERAVGWPMPIERLPDWLEDRFQAVVARDADGRPALAQDSGWRIEREPRRWVLQRPVPQGSLRVVLLLDR